MSISDLCVDGQLDDLYTQATAARQQSRLLAGQLRATQLKTQESWQLIQAAWDRTQQIRALRLASRTDPDRLRHSAYARLQARLASMPVIEQAKGVLMAQQRCGPDEAFELLRRASQRANIKVSVLAAQIVEQVASPTPDGSAEQPRAVARGKA